MSFRWSYFVPFLLRRVVLRRRRLCRLLPLLQFLADHPDFEQNSSRFDLLSNRFELLRGNFIRAVRHVQEHALQFIQRVGESRIAFLQSGLAIQTIFLEQIFRAAPFGGDVHFFLPWIAGRRVGKLDEHSLGMAEVFADGDDQDALPNLLGAGDVVFVRASFRDSAGNEGYDDEGGERSDHGEPPRLEPRLPPCFRSLGQPRSNLLPNAAAVVRAGIRDRQRIESGEDRFDALELLATLVAGGEMFRDRGALLNDALAICNQFLFGHVFHDSVPIARACVLVPTKGCSASRSFCTARKTVFFAALEFNFKTAAISSMPHPSQWRITKAVRSAWERAASACSICLRSSMLCVRRSGVGACCELPEFLIRAQKSLLDDFFGVVLIPGHAKSQPEHVVAVPFDENAKGIALARKRALDGEGVASCDGLGALDALWHPIH